MSFLVDLWIMLSYLGNTKYHLVVIDFDYIQADLFDIFSYYYPHKNSLMLYYSLVLFYYCSINNIKWVRFFFLPNKYVSYLIVSSKIKFPYILESSMTRIPFPLVLALRIICL
jgi:hypothetical protein